MKKIKKDEANQEEVDMIFDHIKSGEYYIKVKDLEEHVKGMNYFNDLNPMDEIFCSYFDDKHKSWMGKYFTDEFYKNVRDFIKGEMKELFNYMKDKGAIEYIEDCEFVIEDEDGLIKFENE